MVLTEFLMITMFALRSILEATEVEEARWRTRSEGHEGQVPGGGLFLLHAYQGI